jgi:heptose-I-phosphate ethanolaminephosphotransferase
VITSRPYTIEALQQVLSFADQVSPERFFTEPTLINIMQQAGYEVTWITNQQTQTKRNTMLTTLSQMADRQVYLNNNRAQNSKTHDEVVLPPLAQALASKAPRKMIVVHLLGTHRKYNYRYPDQFEQFSNADGAPAWVAAETLGKYNSYDNAIRYNDFVLSEIISLLKQETSSTAMAYLSDHGEVAYDTAGQPFTKVRLRRRCIPFPWYCGKMNAMTKPTRNGIGLTMLIVPFNPTILSIYGSIWSA